MRYALLEMRRRPSAFAAPTCILALLGVLLVYPTAVLDGINDSLTSALRSQGADLVVYRRDALRSMFRSNVDGWDEHLVASIDGVASTRPFSAIFLAGTADGHAEPITFAVIDRGPDPALGPGEAVADETLRDRGLVVGSTVNVGPFAVPVRIVGFAARHRLFLHPALLVGRADWNRVTGATDGAAGGSGAAPGSQVLAVAVHDGVPAPIVAAAIDRRLDGRTETLTIEEAVRAWPGTEQLRVAFGLIRVTTLAVAFVVVMVFFSFSMADRQPLHALQKAVGASDRQLAAGVVAQAAVMALAAAAMATPVTLLIVAVVPVGLPTQVGPAGVVTNVAGLGAVSLAASLVAVRQLRRAEPIAALAGRP